MRLLLALAGAHCTASADTRPVQTDCGPVIGSSDPLLGSAFKAIPYAVPPTPTYGQRFRRSQLLSEGNGTCWAVSISTRILG